MNQSNVPTAINAKYRGDVLEFTPPADVDAGTLIPFGSLVGVTLNPIYAGRLGAVAIEGVFDVKKYTNEAIAIGDTVYWDSTDGVATKTVGYSSSAQIMGLCFGSANGTQTVAVSDLASANSTTVTSASGAFGPLCVGSKVTITSGTNFTAGTYTITAKASNTSVTFSANPTNGSSATGGTGTANLVGALAADANVRVKLVPGM